MGRLRQHPWCHVIHPKTSTYTHPHAEAHALVCPPTPAAHGCTHLLRHPCPPHSPAHSGPLHHLLHSKNVLQLALHKLSPPHKPTHVHISRLSHTRMHTRLPTSHIWGRKEATGTNMHACHLRLLAHTCVFAHTSASAHILVFSLTAPPGSKPQTWRMCLSLPGSASPILLMPTGLRTYAGGPAHGQRFLPTLSTSIPPPAPELCLPT